MVELFIINNEGVVSFPNHPTMIEDKIFEGRLDVSKVNIPSSVISIGAYAFSNCKNITNVFIGENLQSIGDNAFKGCNKLNSIYIPKSVNYIAENAFDDCKGNGKEFIYIHGYMGSYIEEYVSKKPFIQFIKLVSEEEIDEAICKFDNGIELEKQVEIFKEASENKYNLFISFKGNLYMAIALLIGRGINQNIKEATFYSDTAYNILLNETSLIKDETKEKMESLEKKLYDYGYEFSTWLQSITKLINLEIMTPLEAKEKLYPEEISIEEAFALQGKSEYDENIVEKLLSKDDSFKVMYIHGLGGSRKSTVGTYLKNNMPYQVLTFDIPLEPKYAMEKINLVMNKFKPDLIVASSLGAYYAMHVDCKYKILINPALDGPSDIDKAIEKKTYQYKVSHLHVYDYTVNDEFIASLNLKTSICDKGTIYGIFGDHDELFSHYEEFKLKCGEDKTFLVNSAHHLDESCFKHPLMDLVEKIRKEVQNAN